MKYFNGKNFCNMSWQLYFGCFIILYSIHPWLFSHQEFWWRGKVMNGKRLFFLKPLTYGLWWRSKLCKYTKYKWLSQPSQLKIFYLRTQSHKLPRALWRNRNFLWRGIVCWSLTLAKCIYKRYRMRHSNLLISFLGLVQSGEWPHCKYSVIIAIETVRAVISFTMPTLKCHFIWF